jgi:hypothetical protein
MKKLVLLILLTICVVNFTAPVWGNVLSPNNNPMNGAPQDPPKD